MTFRFAGLKYASLLASAVLLASTAVHAETVLNRGNGAEPETLDPQKLTGVPEANIAYDLYEGLATLDDHGNPTGGVAKSWDISDALKRKGAAGPAPAKAAKAKKAAAAEDEE